MIDQQKGGFRLGFLSWWGARTTTGEDTSKTNSGGGCDGLKKKKKIRLESICHPVKGVHRKNLDLTSQKENTGPTYHSFQANAQAPV